MNANFRRTVHLRRRMNEYEEMAVCLFAKNGLYLQRNRNQYALIPGYSYIIP